MNSELKNSLLELWKSFDSDNIELALTLAEMSDASSTELNEFLSELKRIEYGNELITKLKIKDEDEKLKFISDITKRVNDLMEKYFIKQISSVKTVNVDDLLK